MIEITTKPLSSGTIINSVGKDDYGAVIAFIGTVRNTCNKGNPVAFLEIEPCDDDAETRLNEIATEIRQKWQLEDIAISRRIGMLKVGEVALVVAVAAPHRQEGFEACQYAVDKIKQGRITLEKDIYKTDETS